MTLREFLDRLGGVVSRFFDMLDAFITTVVNEPFLDWPLWYFVWVGLLGLSLIYLIATLLVFFYEAGRRIWEKVPVLPGAVTRLFAKTDYPVWAGWKGALMSAAWSGLIFSTLLFPLISPFLVFEGGDISVLESVFTSLAISAMFGIFAFLFLMLINLLLYLTALRRRQK